MRVLVKILLVSVVPFGLLAQKPWQQVTTPSVREVAASFRKPAPDFGVLHWAIWGGELKCYKPPSSERTIHHPLAPLQLGPWTPLVSPAETSLPAPVRPPR